MDNEVWKQVKDYPNYSVSNTGRVMNVKFGRELAPIISWDGYLSVNLSKSGKQRMFKIHRLVAENFIDNPLGLETIDHLDSNKTNNRVDNLRWLSRSENIKRFYKEQQTCEQLTKRKEQGKHGIVKAYEKAHALKRKPVICLETGKIYESTTQASKELKIPICGICDNLKGRRKHTHLLHFEYLKK